MVNVIIYYTVVTSKAAAFLLSYDLSPNPLKIAGLKGDDCSF